MSSIKSGLSRRRLVAGALVGILLAVNSVGWAETRPTYPTSRECFEAHHVRCSNTGNGWQPFSSPPPENGAWTPPTPEDPVYNERQKRAMFVTISGTRTTPVVVVDMDQMQFPDAQPYLDPEIGRVRVPIRFVSEQVGAKVEWDQTSRTVTITREGLRIQLRVDDTTAMVNDRSITIDAPPKLIPPGRVMVPLRFITEAFGANVDWVGDPPLVYDEPDWGKYQVWIWVPWGYWGSYSIRERLEVYKWWWHR